jgi:hypothetical protein
LKKKKEKRLLANKKYIGNGVGHLAAAGDSAAVGVYDLLG